MNNVMIDLETLGQGPTSVILSIGAVWFDETGTGNEFYRTVDPQSCVDAGLTMDVSTVMWWMKQSAAARSAFVHSDQLSLDEALIHLRTQIARDDLVWGNGAAFDNVILANAYKAAGMPQPWTFWNDRCYRTLKNLYRGIKAAERTGTHHNALDDARHQAEHASRILKHIKEQA